MFFIAQILSVTSIKHSFKLLTSIKKIIHERGVDLFHQQEVHLRQKLEEIGVDMKILNFIDTLAPEKQKNIYNFFVQIANDELVFVIALLENHSCEDSLKQEIEKLALPLN